MVKVYISEDDGDVHFLIKSSSRKEFEDCVQIFKLNYLKYDSSTKEWFYPIRISIFTIIDALKKNDIEVDISQDDIDVIKLSLYPPSDELKKIKYSIDKTMIEMNPPLVGKEGYENFQLEATRKLVQRNRCYLDISCRHGKTWILCMAMGSLYKLGKIDRIFIICRNEGVENFKREILRFIPYFKEDDIGVVYTYNRNIKEQFNKKIIITNYITFRLSCVYENPKASVKSKKPMIDFSKWGIHRMIVLDEVQSINHFDSIQTHLIQLHREYFEYRYGLSGTLGFNFLNWYSLSKFMLPQRMTMSYAEWRDYVSEGRYNERIKDDKAKEFKETILNNLLITYHDCIVQPKDVEVITYCDMNDEMREIYKSVCEKYVFDIFKSGNGKMKSNDALLKFGELSKLTSNPSLIEKYKDFKIENNPKFDVLKSLLDKYINEQGNKVIIWSVHPQILNTLGKKLSKYKPLIIHGDTSTSVKKEDRITELDEFKKDSTRKILLTNKVLSTSISIVECCRQIYWDLPLNSDDLEQSKERIRGSLQTKQTETNYLLFSKSVDLYIWFEIISKKKKVRDVILNKEYMSDLDFKRMLNPDKEFYVEGSKI